VREPRSGVSGARRELAPRPERYVDARELAALMGVSVSTVKRWVAAGLPSETWGMRRARRFLPSQAMSWARTRPSDSPDRSDALADKIPPTTPGIAAVAGRDRNPGEAKE